MAELPPGSSQSSGAPPPPPPPTPAAAAREDRAEGPGPEAGLFDTDHLQSGLRGRAVRGGAVTLAGQVLRIGLRLIGLAVLARLLVPEDFGLLYGVLAVTGFITVFREAGLSTATIQRDRINPGQISTLFWINVGLGAAVAAAVAALAPVLAWMYDDARAQGVTLALAGTALLAGFGVQHRALLRRQMRFGVTTSIDLVSVGVGLAAAIVAAWYGLGYWALVVEQYAAIAARLVMTMVACPWWPGLPRRGTGVRPMIRFGAELTGSAQLNYASRNADNFLIATFVGAGPLGLYGNAYRLLMLPLRSLNYPLSGVAVPTLSRLQDQPERFARYYFRAIGLLVFLGMPVVGFAFAEAPRLIELVLGPGWLEAADIFRALAPAAFVGTFGVASGWAFVALGRTDRQLRWNVVSTIVTVGAFVAGLPWGALGVAAAFSVVQVLERWPAMWYCYRGTFLRLSDLGRTLARPAVASVGATAGTMGLRALVGPEWLIVLELSAAAGVYVLVYLACWLVMPGGRAELMAMSRTLRDLRRRGEAG